MARLPRVVIPGVPHHVTQRGNRRERTFFEEGDYALYLDLLANAAERAQAEIWSYCLMPNHVNFGDTILNCHALPPPTFHFSYTGRAW